MHGRVLDQVGAQQQMVDAGTQELGDAAQEAPARARGEVADGAAQEGDDARAVVGFGDVGEVALEVADDAVHAQAGELVDQLVGAREHHRLGHVERDVAAQGARLGHRAQQQPRLGRRARAELDELRGAGGLDDLGAALLEDRALGARRVVLGQLADAVEELGAAGVVEVLGRQLLERPREAVEDVVGQRALVAGADEGLDDDRVGGQQGRHQLSSGSVARRRPAKICRRSGRSQLRKLRVATRGSVAHEPPRSTR